MELSRHVAPCSRCETLPARQDARGQLYLWFPLGHTYSKVLAYLVQHNLPHEAFGEEHCARVTLDGPGRELLTTMLRMVMSPEECRDTKALFVLDGRALTLADYARVMPLEQYLGAAEADWLIDMLETKRFTSHFQPIVDAQDPSRIFAYEALFRGLDATGTVVPPARVFEHGRRAGLLFQLDLQARRSAIREAARHGLDRLLFINFNPASIYDPAFCLRSTMRAIDEAGFDRSRVVFEVVESDHVDQPEWLADILDFYRSMGFKVALDDLGAGYASLNLLHALKPDFVKVDMALVRGVDSDPYKAVMTAKILELAHELNIETVAEGVETLSELAWLQQHGACYVQGYLIARPSAPPVRAIALAGTP